MKQYTDFLNLFPNLLYVNNKDYIQSSINLAYSDLHCHVKFLKEEVDFIQSKNEGPTIYISECIQDINKIESYLLNVQLNSELSNKIEVITKKVSKI